MLENEKRPLTDTQIWSLASEDLKKASNIGKEGKTPWKTIGSKLYLDIRDNPNSKFYQFSVKPPRFFLKGKEVPASAQGDYQPIAEVDEQQEQRAPERYLEVDLHPLLVAFVSGDDHFHAYAKTIDQRKAARGIKGQYEWLHPDIVAVHFLFQDFEKREKFSNKNEMLEINELLGHKPVTLFSFELKRSLTTPSLKHDYFEAVSNSSWADEGYLVTLELDEGDDFKDELRRLNNAYGIGVIKLNSRDPFQSEILWPARKNSQLDWNTINRLSEQVEDFRNFLKWIKECRQAGRTIREEERYDPVMNEDQLRDHIRRTAIPDVVPR